MNDALALPELFAAQAARTPDAIAVETLADGASGPVIAVTYGVLERRANRLAHRLRALGAGPGTTVGVSLRREPDLLVALLGVWKAGAAYVPLDPDHPVERLAWVLSDTGTPLVLSGGGILAPSGAERVIPVETEDSGGFPDTADGLCPPDPARTAYVLHTSGSTGRPKGVMVTHAGIANRVRHLTERHDLRPSDRVLQKTTIGFDAAALELFAPLISGGTVVLAPDGVSHDPTAMVRAVADGRVTVLQAVPSVLRALADAPGWAACGALRLIFSAGEPLHAELCHRLLARVPDAEIWNTCGPTECSVDVTEHRFDPAQTTGPVPIGQPLTGMRAVLLDALGHPVPRGAVGELHVGGVGLADGYLGRAALTAERFIPDPYGPPGARLYRTGDRARWRSDGVLEYLGRLDQQVKVNGVRVEPGEVEAALATHPEVSAAVVGTRPGAGGSGRLVAWIQARGSQPNPRDLREFLRRSLPAPFVPSVFVPVDDFPRTSSDKVDRAALPDPAPVEETTVEHVLLEGAGEHQVAQVWADMLDIPVGTVGAHDDFFQRGGSSLLLTQLAERMRDATGRQVSLLALFTATTVREQAALLAGLVSERPSEPVTPQPRDIPLPLSPGQQGLWLSEQMRPGSPEWITPLWIHLPAHWSDRDVRIALERLAARHEILRTRYVLRDDNPVQIIETTPPAPELRAVEATHADVERAALEEEFARGFDLERGPVWRALLVRRPDGAPPVLVMTIHHIACDGWSTMILARDLRALGEAARDGTPVRLPELPVQYADHALWQHRQVDGTALGEQLAHWRTVLKGTSVLELPTDRPRPPERNARGAIRTVTVPARLADRVEALARSVGATTHQTLLAAFAALLTRLTGQPDVVIGVPVAGRSRPEVAETVGFFVNTLPLRLAPGEDRTVTEAVAHVRDAVRDALTHQDVPFGRLVQELAPSYDPARTPLYQVMFDFHEDGRTGTGDMDLDAFRTAWHSARTDLTLVVERRTGHGLQCVLEYATALFDAATVDRFGACWVRLLESFAAAPGGRLAEAELLPADESARILALGAAETAHTLPGGCVHTAFEETVRRVPGSTAVVHAGVELTYRQLDEQADRFAHRLRALGAGPETAVALMLDRTPDLIAAVLGIWKAGATQVPLDPAAPDERLAHILTDAHVGVVVSDGPGVQRLSVLGDVRTLSVDDPHSAVVLRTPLDVGLSPSRLAYILYTSGSTGRPKGVGVEHRSLLSMLDAARENLGFGGGPSDAWLALARPTFDISFTELFMPLVAGGRVVLADTETVGDPPAQLDLIERHGVTHLQVAPSHWRMLIDAGLGERPLTGLTGGEPCPPALARDLARRLKRFLNEYGLTETTIAATYWNGDPAATVVPIGRPYPHATARVLDPCLRPVLPGVDGELYIGGAGVARGYTGRPELTAERFLPDPYGPPGARLFRTGDIARMLPDGNLLFAGRRDGQVKIRGRRVETGEVRATLVEHPGLAEAVVTVHGVGDDARLVAYCVPSGGSLPPTAELLAHCGRHLPDYMLPALFVPLTALPLTAHNKVDIAALPAPDLTAAAADEPYTAPRGAAEEAVATVWAEVLVGPDGRAPRVGVHHDFLRLGGDSLRAARLVARIRETFDVTLPLRTVFARRTVAELTQAVEEAVRAEIATLTDEELEESLRSGTGTAPVSTETDPADTLGEPRP
ncbi:amino acid adenylation domain-containing protein [Streptomyces sp. NPDC058301]|uniref:amino acid adenylation domain-containing protein n=1 Tax=Streptomyces sp. NPDC058301 TaxID=3346436 RepID=UPI0036E3348E